MQGQCGHPLFCYSHLEDAEPCLPYPKRKSEWSIIQAKVKLSSSQPTHWLSHIFIQSQEGNLSFQNNKILVYSSTTQCSTLNSAQLVGRIYGCIYCNCLIVFLSSSTIFSTMLWHHNIHKHFEFSSLSCLTTTMDGIYGPYTAHHQEVMKMLRLQF